MYISRVLEGMAKKKYQEMKETNKAEDFLDREKFGEIKIFINPKEDLLISSLTKFTVGDDIVYVGSK